MIKTWLLLSVFEEKVIRRKMWRLKDVKRWEDKNDLLRQSQTYP